MVLYDFFDSTGNTFHNNKQIKTNKVNVKQINF